MKERAFRFTRPYLDADVWIHALQGTPVGQETVRPLLVAADSRTLKLVVSAIMPLEVLRDRADDPSREAEARALAALSRPNVVEVPVGRAVVLQARRLRLDHGLQSMDALHLASALRGRADVFLTFDDKALRLGLLEQMLISKPYWPGDTPLPGLDA
ncbi:MAG: type II toxin-antitoxin system VapC family toxin [Mycobacteriaceae bacterium]